MVPSKEPGCGDRASAAPRASADALFSPNAPPRKRARLRPLTHTHTKTQPPPPHTNTQARSDPIEALDAGNNALTSVSALPLARLLASDNAKTHLRELSVYANELRDEGVEALAEALAGCSALRVLDLGGNEVTARGAEALAAALRGGGAGGGGGSALPTFKSSDAGKGGAPPPPPPLAASLRTLELGYNPLGPEGVAAVAGAFKSADAQIEALKLGWCKAGGGAGAAALADLLLLNASLVCLDLRGNGLGNEGAVRLARALRAHAKTPGLEELDLGYNEVRDDGACALAQALKANAESAPAELRLSQNYVTRFGQVALQEAVDVVQELGGGRTTSVQF